MLHPIHTPLHCQHQANTAYDKLAVISDNMPKIQEVEQFIFELRQWLRAYLEGIKVDFDQALQDLLTGDNIWEGNNTYIKDITLRDGDIYWKDANGNNLAWVTYDAEHQILTFHAGNKEIQLSADGSIAPTTNPDLTTAIVTLDYLNQVLEGYLSTLTFDDTPTDGSTNPVTSDGIYEALQDVIAMIPDLTIDDTVTEESENPVTSSGIYTFITGLLGNIPNPEQYALPIASDAILGGIKVGNYLTINANGVLSVDIATLRDALGLGGVATSDSWTTVTETITDGGTTWDQGANGFPWYGETNNSFIKAQTGTTNSYLVPVVSYGHTVTAGLSQSNLIKGVAIGATITCKNTSTNVTVKYVPVRTVGYMANFSVSGGGSGPGGLGYLVKICAFYRKSDYTLTSADIAEINAEASEFLAQSQNWGISSIPNNGIYDTGALE